MNKTKLLLTVAALFFASIANGQYSGGGGVTAPIAAQLATKLALTNITQTVTSETDTVPSNKAVEDALALKAGTTNAVLNWSATADGTNYVIATSYAYTNGVWVKTVDITEE